MSLPDCKRQKLADNVNPVAEMSNVSPKKDCGTRTGDVTITACSKPCVINKNFQDFKDVASLDGFVDRTMLIKELLEPTSRSDPKKVMMFAPSKFGKTINLNMIRSFCDIEDKNTKTKKDVANNPTMQELRSKPSKNMKVFLRQFEDKQYEECLILKQEEFVIQHFGRHPVVLFNFKDCRPRDESQALFSCAERVRKGYLENDYLEESKEFQSGKREHARLKQKCKNWCSYDDAQLNSLNLEEVINGLKDLIKSLRLHWGRDPIFLVDEIDKPCLAAMEKKRTLDEVQEIGNVVCDVVCSILKQEGEEFKLEAALLSGISKFKNTGLSPVDNTVEVYFLGDARFSNYYGLTTKEIDSLVRKFYISEGVAEITTIINHINMYYNGYYQRSFSGEKEKLIEYARYCLFSVLNYIKQRNENKNNPNLTFWDEGGLIGRLVPVLKKSEVIMSAIQTLLYDDSGTIGIKYQREVNAEHLLGIYREEIVPNPDATFNFFLQRGFLAHHPEKAEEKILGGVQIYVRIPNSEIRDLYYMMFTNYHASLPKAVTSAFTSCGDFFKSLPTALESSMHNSKKFQEDLDKLCENLKCIFSFVNCHSEASVCCYMLNILKCYAGYEKGELNYTVQYLDNNRKQKCVYIDVWGKHGNFVLILEAKHNEAANGEPGKIGCKTRNSLAAAEDIVTLLPGKEEPEDIGSRKAGTGRNLKALNSDKITTYLLMGLTVDGDGTAHMLVFPKSSEWKDVITVNPEIHVKEAIEKYKNW